MKPRLDAGLIQIFAGSSARPADLDRVDVTVALASMA